MNISELETEIRRHRHLYYNTPENVEISDGEFDALVDTLRDLKPDSSILTEVGAPIPFGIKFKHKVPMVSLNKVNNLEEFEKWVEINNRIAQKINALVLSLKLDGVSFSLIYREGKFVRASTRGDGFEGENITEHVKKMKNFKQNLLGEVPGFLELRGEMILTKDLFKKHFSKEALGDKGMKNARNAVSGLTKRHDLVGCEYIQLLYFNVLGLKFEEEYNKVKYLEDLGFETVPSWLMSIDKIKKTIPEFIGKRDSLSYEIDGLVLKINDLKTAKFLDRDRILMGHNPKSQIAFKFESEKKVSTLLDIEWSLGARGHITPVAILKPLEFFGVTVKRASLANIAEIKRLGVMIGDDLLVERANDVIPKVLKVIKKGDKRHLELPTHCPQCGSFLDVSDKFLSCLNQECSGKSVGSIKTWVKNLGIKEFGPKLIDTLIEKKLVKSISDLYNLKIIDLVQNIERFGEKSSIKVLKNLHSKKEMSLHVFLGSLGIRDCSRSTFKLLEDSGLDTLEKMFSAQVEDLLKIKGIAEATAKAIVVGLEQQKGEIVKLSEVLIISKQEAFEENILSGKSFQVTGSLPIARKDWVQLVEKNGGLVKSVTKNLDYLVTEDPSSSSNKIKKAQNLGVKVISFEEFMEMLK